MTEKLAYHRHLDSIIKTLNGKCMAAYMKCKIKVNTYAGAYNTKGLINTLCNRVAIFVERRIVVKIEVIR